MKYLKYHNFLNYLRFMPTALKHPLKNTLKHLKYILNFILNFLKWLLKDLTYLIP